MSVFKFKSFSIEQDNSAMKVNTDGVLLGAWMDIKASDRRFLDVGTGTGVIALMCAQRIEELNSKENISGKIEIDALEIDSNSVIDAVKNIYNSPWKNIKVIETAFEDYNCDIPYDMIFSNPPFFVNSLKNPCVEKAAARHSHSLSQSQIISSSLRLLKKGGRLAIILPTIEAKEFIKKNEFIRESKSDIFLELNRLCEVSTIETKATKRYLMEFTVQDKYIVKDLKIPLIKEKLAIIKNGNYSERYIDLTKGFYLYPTLEP